MRVAGSRPLREYLGFVDDLAHKNSEALSFIPRPMLERYAEAGQVMLAKENGEPCGFLIHGNGARWCRIYQACIQYDARYREHGLSLVRALIEKATRQGFEAISLWCASDLDSNKFWQEAGFSFAGCRAGGQRRGRQHNHWMLWLQPVLWSGECGVLGESKAPALNDGDNPRPTCTHCRGSGKVRYYHGDFDTCPTCHGNGVLPENGAACEAPEPAGGKA